MVKLQENCLRNNNDVQSEVERRSGAPGTGIAPAIHVINRRISE